VKKRSVKEANQRVAAARTLDVKLSHPTLTETLQALFERWNDAANEYAEASLEVKGRLDRWASSGRLPSSRHYFLLEQPDHLMITFGTTATKVAERGLNATSRGWVAWVTGGAPEGEYRRIQVALVGWCSEKDSGLMWNGDRYEALLDGLVSELDGRYVTAPIDPVDLRFVRPT
jgi:hypothetical protein